VEDDSVTAYSGQTIADDSEADAANVQRQIDSVKQGNGSTYICIAIIRSKSWMIDLK
jgi:hypothetical protein